MASAQPGDHVVTAKLSRTFRSVRDGSNALHQFKLRNVQFHVTDLPLDTKKASGRLVQNVSLAMDQYTREIASEAAREVVAYRKKHGLPYSRGVPIGWEVVGEKPRRTFRVDMQERALCDRIAQMYARGLSLPRIAYWNTHQIELPCKRRFTNRFMVKHCINARACGYPRISGYKQLRRMIRLGEI